LRSVLDGFVRQHQAKLRGGPEGLGERHGDVDVSAFCLPVAWLREGGKSA
jgi:hypothetical protein